MNRREFIGGLSCGAVATIGMGYTYGRFKTDEMIAFLEPNEMNPGANPYWIPQSLGYFRALAELA